MRKILSLIITIVILANAVPVFAEGNKTETDISEYVIDTITGIGIVDDYYDGSVAVSRGEFAKMIIKLCRLESIVDENAQPLFYDVSLSNEYYPYIMLAARHGIMEGDENKKFYPNQTIKTSDALIVSARVLGAIGSLKDVLNANDIIATEHLGKNLSQEKELTLDDAVQLMFNIFNARCYCTDVDFLNGKLTEAGKKKRFYENYWDIGKISNKQVAANQHTSLDSPDGTSKGYVVIDNEKYKVGDTNADGLLGCVVDAYFVDDDDEKTLISIDNKNKDNMITVSCDDISDKTTIRKLVYYQNGKEKQEDISSSDIIYNNVCSKHHTNEDLRINTGWITLISSGNDDIYDVVKVDTYKNIFVSGIDVDNKIIYDKNSADFVELEDGRYSLEGISGSVLDISSLSEEKVISVYESINKTGKKYTRMIVSSKEPVSGKITAYQEEGSGNVTIELDGEEYVVSRQYIDNHEKYPKKTPLLKAGMEVKLYPDAYGIIASASEVNTDLKYGYLTKMWRDSGLNEDNVYFKIYSQDDEFIKCKAKDKMKINGQNMKAAVLFEESNLYDKNTGKSKDQLVRYRLNADGEMSEFEYVTQMNVVPHLSTSDMLVHNVTFSERIAFRTHNKIGGKYILGSDTVIFKIPVDVEQTKGFSIEKSFADDTILPNATVYNCSDVYKMGAMVCRESQTLDFTDDLYLNVIKTKKDAMNSNGENVHYIEYYKQGNLLKAYTADDEVLKGIDAGDIVQFLFNNSGEIKACKPIFKVSDKPQNPIEWCIYKNHYDYKSPGTPNNPNNRDYSPLAVVYGICLGKDENIITVTGFDEAGSVYSTRTDGAVYRYDTEKRTVSVGGFDEISTSASMDNLTGSVVLTNSRNDLGRELYIIK